MIYCAKIMVPSITIWDETGAHLTVPLQNYFWLQLGWFRCLRCLTVELLVTPSQSISIPILHLKAQYKGGQTVTKLRSYNVLDIQNTVASRTM